MDAVKIVLGLFLLLTAGCCYMMDEKPDAADGSGETSPSASQPEDRRE